MLPSRQVLLAILCAMASAAVCAAQTPVRFSQVTSKSATSSTIGGTPSNIYSADLNNDGIPDLIQDVGDSPDQFAVSLGKGDGTFKAPVNYSYPAGSANTPQAAMAFGDFNGDGNVDLVAAVIGTGTLAVYLGNGNGTLQAPKTYTLTLSDGDTIAASQLVAADFNRDGKLDLVLTGEVVTAAGTAARLYVLPGNGDGTFAAPQVIYSMSTPIVPGFAPPIAQVATGDFDGDGNADIAFTHNSNEYGPGTWNVEVLSGDGHLGFTAEHIVTDNLAPHGFMLATGDLNGDGYTDLIVFEPDVYFLYTYFGGPGRGFRGQITQEPYADYGSGLGLSSRIAVADFNDDGQMDFAIPAGLGDKSYWMFFLGTGSPGQFATQTWNLPHYANQSNPVVGLFNRDNKPDLALVQYNAAGDSVITTELNGKANGLWSNCPYPLKGRGISRCSPISFLNEVNVGFLNSPVDFTATAHSFGQLRKMELWVDGKMLSEQHNVWGSGAFLRYSAGLAPGPHQGTILAVDTDSTPQKQDFSFIVGQPTCKPPATDGVQICTFGSDDQGTLLIASATVSGTLARMELWADGAKEYTETTSNNLSASIGLTAGRHTLTVVAVNTDGTAWNQSLNLIVP